MDLLKEKMDKLPGQKKAIKKLGDEIAVLNQKRQEITKSIAALTEQKSKIEKEVRATNASMMFPGSMDKDGKVTGS